MPKTRSSRHGNRTSTSRSTLMAQLERYIDRLEVQTGLKANRGMIARRALARFLKTR